MKTHFVVSDIHGFYDEMLEALYRAGFDDHNDDHVFVSCGDLFDRGPDALKCLRFVNGLDEKHKILIKGNHEDLLKELLDRKRFEWYDIHNGTDDTVRQFKKMIDRSKLRYQDLFDALKENDELQNYYASLCNFHETEKYIFVHGWIPVYDNGLFPVYDPSWRNGDFKEAAWSNGYDMYKQGIKEDGKTIVCGHVRTSYGHSNLHNDGEEFGSNMNCEIFYDEGIIGLDACTANSHKVNVLVLNID